MKWCKGEARSAMRDLEFEALAFLIKILPDKGFVFLPIT